MDYAVVIMEYEKTEDSLRSKSLTLLASFADLNEAKTYGKYRAENISKAGSLVVILKAAEGGIPVPICAIDRFGEFVDGTFIVLPK